MSRLSLTVATDAYLRAQGWVGAPVERRLGPITVDYLGWADWVGIRWDYLQRRVEALGVQLTSTGHGRDRLRKMQRSPGLERWLDAGGQAALITWGKDGLVITEVTR